MSEESTNCSDCKIKDLCPKHIEKCAISGYEADYQTIVKAFSDRLSELEKNHIAISKLCDIECSKALFNIKQEIQNYYKNSNNIWKHIENVESVLKDVLGYTANFYRQDKARFSFVGNYDTFRKQLDKGAGGNRSLGVVEYTHRGHARKRVSGSNPEEISVDEQPTTDAPAVYTPFPMMTLDEYRRNLCRDLLDKQREEFVKNLKHENLTLHLLNANEVEMLYESMVSGKTNASIVKQSFDKIVEAIHKVRNEHTNLIEKWQKRLEEQEK